MLAEVIKEDEFWQPTEVELIAHSKARDEIYARLSNSRTRRILMALDTGSTYVLIPWDIAEALEYERTNLRILSGKWI